MGSKENSRLTESPEKESQAVSESLWNKILPEPAYRLQSLYGHTVSVYKGQTTGNRFPTPRPEGPSLPPSGAGTLTGLHTP